MKQTTFLMVVALSAVPGINLQAKVDFAKEIHPIFEHSCVKCHGAEKQKGKLRLDSRDAALKGGKDGPAFVVGEPEKSELIRRVSLPKSDDDVMPSEGDPLTKAQIDLLKAWISEGAEWPESSSLVKTDESKKPAIPAPVLPTDFKPGAGEAKAIAEVAKSGTDIRPVAMNSIWREANFRLQGTSVTDQVIAPLKDVPTLIDLNLANTRVTDAGLASLKNLPHLQRLHLELTKISDAGLAHLKGLTNLTYLNLYGTAVTDGGLQQLENLKFLRSLYVWQTKVTDAGVQKLKASIPNLEVSSGADLVAFAKIAEEAKEKMRQEEAKKKAEEEAKKKSEAEKKEAEKKEKEAKKEEAKKEETLKVDPEKKPDADKKPDAEKKPEAEKKPDPDKKP